MGVLCLLVKDGESIAVFPVGIAKKVRQKIGEDLELLPNGQYAIFEEGGKLRFEKLERVLDDPAVKKLAFRYIPDLPNSFKPQGHK